MGDTQKVREIIIPRVILDALADDSDKVIVPSVDNPVRIQSLNAVLVSTITGGNRVVGIEIRDSAGNVLFETRSAVNQAASLTYNYQFAPGLTDSAALLAGDRVHNEIPAGLIIPAGGDIHVLDIAAIDIAADDLTLRLLVEDLIAA